MATCMDMPVEKEITATPTEGRSISASNKKRASNKKNFIDMNSSFRLCLNLLSISRLIPVVVFNRT
jgi:hypothetical protein